MDDSLKNELEQLLKKYPELKNSQVSFTSSEVDITVADGNNLPGNASVSVCELVSDMPDVIPGHSPKIEVRKSLVHGYGVFAKENIQAGELIEISKLLRLGWRGKYMTDPVLLNYAWGNKSCECNECKTHGHYQYIALGLCSLYNHADKPNTVNKNDFAAQTITITAVGDIKKDEEIFVSYGHKYFLVRNFWKKVRENKSFEKFLEQQVKNEE